MDFALPADVEDLRSRVATFVRERIVPLEADRASYDEHENIALDVLQRTRDEVKAAGLWSPQVPKAMGGLGLSVVGRAACYEEMNTSIFGPVCFNCAAPDDGNMTVLAKVATKAQQERWLAPIVDGRVRSAFVMTEPHPGGGHISVPLRQKYPGDQQRPIHQLQYCGPAHPGYIEEPIG